MGSFVRIAENLIQYETDPSTLMLFCFQAKFTLDQYFFLSDLLKCSKFSFFQVNISVQLKKYDEIVENELKII